MSILIWRIVCITIMEISLFNFILIEIVIAIGEFFTKFGLAKAEGKPTDFKTKKTYFIRAIKQVNRNLSL